MSQQNSDDKEGINEDNYYKYNKFQKNSEFSGFVDIGNSKTKQCYYLKLFLDFFDIKNFIY